MFMDKSPLRFLILAMVLVVATWSLSGCASMRRKFVRQRKAKDTKETMVPVLQPEEYAPVVEQPIEVYRMHYSICRAYFGDLWETLGRGYGDKRERYLVSQIAVKIDSLADLLQDGLKEKLKALSSKVMGALTELDKPLSTRRYDSMRSDLRAVENILRREFKPDIAGKSLK